METNYVENWQRRSASPSTFTLCQGRNNRLSLLSSSSIRSSDARSLTRSPPPSYDGLTGLPNFASVGADSAQQGGGDDVSATLDAHLPLSVSDKGWSEVESVSKQFLAENLPGWIASMQQAETGGAGQKLSNATGQQQKPFTQMIKAGVRKGRKGLVLRLLRRTLDANEIVDLRLDNGAIHEKSIRRTYAAPTLEPAPEQQQTAGGDDDDGLGGPPSEPLPPVELEARPPAAVVHQVPGLHEAPAEPAVFELPTSSATPVPRPAVGVPPQRPPARDRAADQAAVADQAERDDGDEDVFLATSPTESLLRTLSFGPEEASAWSEPVMDTSDSDYSPPSSIVPTPTKGLSVRHATHRLVKRSRSGGTFASGASEGSRTLPLDMESLNRRLMQSSVKSENEQQSRMGSDNARKSLEPQETADSSGPVHHEQKQLVRRSANEHELQGTPRPHSDQIKADSIAIGNDVATGVDRPTISTARREADSMAATSRSAPRWEGASTQHDLQIPEASGKLVISTNCGPGSDGTTNNVPMASGPIAVHTPMQVRQDDVRSQMSPHFESNGPMHELRDASQGSFDGSVTLPTLNLSEPDSPGGSLWLPSNIEIRPLPEKRSPVHSFLSHATKATLAQLGRVAAGLYDAYGPEKPVPKDHVRVRWTCTCGKELYDDFIERRRGAARELEAYLNRPRAHASPSSPSHSAHSSFSEPSQVFSNNPSLAPSPATTWGSLGGGDVSPSNYSPTALRSNNPFSVRVSTLPPTRWLLTCADEGEFTTKLSHVDVTETKIRSDRDLAMAVRSLYSHVNRKWWRILRLRGLTSIDFVQFEVHRNRVVDIRKCPDMPPVSSSKQAAHGNPVYDFEPHDLVPPVGTQYLMHLFAHPEDYDNEFVTYARAPKRRGARLDVGVGWGINLVEGFLADRVWLLVMLFFVLGSSVFAVVWACKRGDDVQGAFGVAGWMLTLAALVVGWAQASLG
ncbi:Transcription factor c2h2 [Lasiodiplodia theobromae]|uniref:Transcription factor c2h2 n=1 Tax=Lasiodiplodia theobromae TaxID=45133 RepID=UPI0015C34D73|nr:Transcription factor c2h2 [Lasiodiplodia theobromae]KAF4542542.1 Transcription factor c2h2 [Lasiodiplodia theobromae]